MSSLFGTKEPTATLVTGTPEAVKKLLPGSEGSSGGWIVTVLGVAALAVVGILFWNWLQKRNGLPGIDLDFGIGAKSSGDQAPAPLDGKVRTVIPAASIPPGPGSDFGIQYWMYISNWDYKFGADKEVLKRISPTSGVTYGPRISMSPSDNTLNIQMSVYPSSTAAGAASPDSTSSTGDSFTCSVENVPLQSWFSVSATVFQRNLDVYINGRLVKSCVLPGVPKIAVGDMIVGDNGGFAGSVCNVNYYGTMLTPDDTMKFFMAGTNCAPPGDQAGKPVDKDSIFITLFGYTFRFSTLDKAGKELSSYTL